MGTGLVVHFFLVVLIDLFWTTNPVPWYRDDSRERGLDEKSVFGDDDITDDSGASYRMWKQA